MSCYLRHLNDVLIEAGIDHEKMDGKEVDRAIHQVVGVEYKHCPDPGRVSKQSWIGTGKASSAGWRKSWADHFFACSMNFL